MSIDFEKMKEKMSRAKGEGSKSSVFWRPPEGESCIRIVPTPDGDPFKEYWFHYNVGKNPAFLSPKKNFGMDCPLDNFVKKLFSEGTEDSIRMAKNLMARQRFFSPVLVRGEEELGVRLWGYGKMAYQELLGLVLNPEYGDITDTNEGTDLVINYGKPPGASFPQTSIPPRRRPSPLVESSEEAGQLLDSIPDFSQVFDRKTSEQVQAMLDEFLLGEDGAESASSETTKYGGGETSSVDSAFKELLGD